MARLFDEGFELGDNLQSSTPGGSVIVSTGLELSGSFCLDLNGGNTNIITLSAASAEYYIRFRSRVSSTPGVSNYTLLQWRTGTTVLGSLRVNATTKYLELYTGTATLVATGTTTMLGSTTYLFELHVKIADVGGALDVKIGSVAEVSYSGDTKPGADTTMNNLVFGTWASAHSYFDDIGVNDVAGGSDISWLGDGRYFGLVPNGDGDLSEWDGSDGNQVNNYLLVDDTPTNNDTDYVTTGVADKVDLYNLPDTLPVGAIISRVWVNVRGRNDQSGGSANCRGVLKINGTIYEGTTIALPAGGSYGRVVWGPWLVNPDDSQAWEKADIDAMQAGIKSKA